MRRGIRPRGRGDDVLRRHSPIRQATARSSHRVGVIALDFELDRRAKPKLGTPPVAAWSRNATSIASLGRRDYPAGGPEGNPLGIVDHKPTGGEGCPGRKASAAEVSQGSPALKMAKPGFAVFNAESGAIGSTGGEWSPPRD